MRKEYAQIVKNLRSLADNIEGLMNQKEPISSKVEIAKVTLKEVKETLVALTRAGKQREVKALIENCGASKLSEVPEDQYAVLLEEARKL